MMRFESPIVPTVWTVGLRDLNGQQLLQQTVHNMILSPGQRDALMQLIGLRPPGVYKWIGIGSSSQRESANQAGVRTPLRLSGVPYRAAGEWSVTGTDFTLDVAILGTTISGNVRELALYASQVGGVALYRIVLPATLPLTSSNTLTVAVVLSP